MCFPFSFQRKSSSSLSSSSNIKITFSSGPNSRAPTPYYSTQTNGGDALREASKFSTMLYYSLDPQFAAFVFSLYARHERPSSLAIFPDTLGCPTHSAVSSTADIISYAHAVSLQLIALGEHYACLFTQLRTGSVIFLVGVGSLVCWKLWEHWKGGDADQTSIAGPSLTPPPSSPGKLSARDRARGLLASFMTEDLVQDEDLMDEDPAFIQHLITLGKMYLRELLMSKYFGPNSPMDDDLSGPSSVASIMNADLSPRHYLADNSTSITNGEGVLSSEESSLPTDEESDLADRPTSSVKGKRKVRRRHKLSELNNRSLAMSPRIKTDHQRNIRSTNRLSNPSPNKSGHSHGLNALSACDNLKELDANEILSSETSPIHPPIKSLVKKRIGGTDTPDSEELQHLEKARRGSSQMRPYVYANDNSDEDWSSYGRTPEEKMQNYFTNLSRNSSLSDLVERMRYRGSARASISRDASVCSNLSDLNSPLGFRKYPFHREDSICSNMSDLAPSECSEISLDVSLKDEFISHHTITHLADIEHELDELKSTMLEMDEEVMKFTALPNPYMLKTTFSDNSMTSGESRPNSALEVFKPFKSRPNIRGLPTSRSMSLESESGELPLDKANSSNGNVQSNSEAEISLEWDSPAHGWSTLQQSTPLARLSETSFDGYDDSKQSVNQDETIPSLEWDNDGLLDQLKTEDSTLNENEKVKKSNINKDKEVFHENEIQSLQSMDGFEEYKSTCKWNQLLPDHSILELDLEKELSEIPAVTDMSDILNSNVKELSLSLEEAPVNMTTSVDSAIYSAAGSRSASSSPLPQSLSQSMMSSGIATSFSEDFLADAPEAAPWTTAQNSKKLKKYWSSEESGYVDCDVQTDSANKHLSPVHEIKERDTTDSAQSSPQHSFQTVINNYPDTTPTSDSNLGLNSFANENNLNNNFSNTQVMGNTAASKGNKTDSMSNRSNAAYKRRAEYVTNRSSSNSSEGEPQTTTTTTLAVGEKVDVVKYATTEWHGNTQKARTIRQGYYSIPSQLGLKNLRRIRGDNYCGIRATAYQLLSAGHQTPSGTEAYARLVNELNSSGNWLKKWSFGKRLPYSEKNVAVGFKKCLETLDNTVNDLSNLENRENVLLSLLNTEPQLDILICEAIKLHMMVAALDLYESQLSGDNMPLFAMIMFARQSSSTPEQLMLNHFNPIGDTAGLEQIEMFLLGHTLNTTLQVVRPFCYSEDDFICFYPDSNIGNWPELTLIAEDDRHYNVLVR